MKLLLTLGLALSLSPLATSLAGSTGPTGPTGPAPAPAAFTIDAGHSTVLFRTKHVGVSYFYGRFNRFEGTVAYDEANPSSSGIQLEIDAESIDSNSEGRDRHLRSNDFFSVKEFPRIGFESKSVTEKGDGLEVAGALTFHGVTRDVTAAVEVVGTGEAMGAYRAGFEARLQIDMRDYGVSFVEKTPGAVGPEVDLIISLECTRD